MKWRCTVCNYIHEGDAPPEKCPVCGAGPERFVLVEETSDDELTKSEYDLLQSLLFNCSYGLYIVTSSDNGQFNGMTSNSFLQVTSEPLRGSVCINKANKTCEMIQKSRTFGINVLGQTNHDLVAHFGFQSGHQVDKFTELVFIPGKVTGSPALSQTLAFMEFQVINTVDLGTHIMFIGDLVGGEQFQNAEPMTYAYYRATK